MANLILPYHARHDTIAYLKTQALFRAQSMREVELASVVKQVRPYLSLCGTVAPEKHAIDFYVGNAIWGEILKRYAPDQPLPPEVLNVARDYVRHASVVSQRLMYYLLLIISRESRHSSSLSYPAMIANHGSDFQATIAKMHGHQSMAAKDIWLNNFPKMQLGAYADAVSWTFHNAGFSGGFGGKKWAAIADVFKGCVGGALSPEMLTDVSWALCHNGGPIFNKQMTYDLYDSYALKQVLDAQRAGQIPEYISDPSIGKGYVTSYAQSMADRGKLMFPGVWGKIVDWQKVQEAGAVQNYQNLIKKTVAAKPKGNVYYIAHDKYVPVITKARTA